LKNTILQGDLLSSLQEERRLQQQEEKYKSLGEPQKGAHSFIPSPFNLITYSASSLKTFLSKLLLSKPIFPFLPSVIKFKTLFVISF
jgi:hypothetical protein